METLLVVDQHRNQYHYNGRGKMNGNGSGGRFGSSPARGFREINCRAFESGAGLLPNPFVDFGSLGSHNALLTPKDQTIDGGCSGKVNSGEGKNLERIVSDGLLTPKGQALGGGSNGKMKIDEGKMLKRYSKSSPISINSNGNVKERFVREDLAFSELWAGPAYSNSPPPSSLPIPKFSMKPKRTVSLELRELESDLSLQPMAKSAPASPTRKFVGLPGGFGGDDDDFATKTLRRILNLDIADD